MAPPLLPTICITTFLGSVTVFDTVFCVFVVFAFDPSAVIVIVPVAEVAVTDVGAHVTEYDQEASSYWLP